MVELVKILEEEMEKSKRDAKSTEETINEWRDAVEKLYSKIEGWLGEERQKRLVRVTKNDFFIKENYLGEYPIKRLILGTPGNMYVYVEPKARYIVGGTGRVDIYNTNKPLVKYVVVRKKDDNKWYFIEKTNRLSDIIDYSEFDEENFKEILVQLIK